MIVNGFVGLWFGSKRSVIFQCMGAPASKFLNLNTDASVVNGRASGGGLVRDVDGKVIFAFYKEFGDVDVLTAEAMSLLHRLWLCYGKGLHGIYVESDSLSLVQLVESD